MDNDNQIQIFFCADDDENRVYCNICDKIVIDRYNENHLKPGTHFVIIHRNND